MRQFKDTEGVAWTVEAHIGSLKRVLALAQIDLLKPTEGDPPPIVRLDRDIACLVDCLYAIVQPQAEQRDVSDVQFAERLGGQAVADARAALMAELHDFFQSAGRRDVAGMIDRQNKLVALALEHELKTIENPEIETILIDQINRGRERMMDTLRLGPTGPTPGG